MLTIEQIFADYSPRYRQGKNEWNMKCPFRENHNAYGAGDGSKSFFVNPEKNYYNCFSCGVHGNLISLLTTKMEIDFMEAHEIVTTTNIDYLFRDSNVKQLEAEFDTIIPLEPPESFIKRGFSKRFLARFRVGSDGDLICIPILNNEGTAIVGIRYRKGRDFWFAPEGFNKNLYLYNFVACKGHKWFVLVEGETDVYRSTKNGVKNCCATLGGILSEEQTEVIKNENFDEVRLAFDKDAAGLKNIEIANYRLSPFLRVNIVDYDAEDPGKCERDEWLHAVHDNYVDYSSHSVQMSIEAGDEYLTMKKKAIQRLKKS